MNRVKDLEVYITVSADGQTFYPKEGFPKTENYPYASIGEYHGGRVSLGAQGNWEADPWGKPEKPRYVEFRAQGPGALIAIEAIRVVLSKPPPDSKLGIAAGSFGTMFKYLTSSSTPGQGYRPSGYRPAGVDNKLSEKADRMEREREEIRKRWERRGGVLGRRET